MACLAENSTHLQHSCDTMLSTCSIRQLKLSQGILCAAVLSDPHFNPMQSALDPSIIEHSFLQQADDHKVAKHLQKLCRPWPLCHSYRCPLRCLLRGTRQSLALRLAAAAAAPRTRNKPEPAANTILSERIQAPNRISPTGIHAMQLLATEHPAPMTSRNQRSAFPDQRLSVADGVVL